MCRIQIHERAHTDLRLKTAAPKLGMTRETLAWRLIALWSYAVEQQTANVPADFVAAALGIEDMEELASVLEHCDLAYSDDRGNMILYLGDLFGTIEYYQKQPMEST